MFHAACAMSIVPGSASPVYIDSGAPASVPKGESCRKSPIPHGSAAKGMSEIGYRGLFNFEVSAAKLPLETREIYAKYLISAAEKIIGMMD